MIEILEKGEPKSERKFTVGCRGCNSKLRYSKSDGVVVHDQRDGDFLKLDCPVCHKDINVNLSEMEANSFFEPRVRV